MISPELLKVLMEMGHTDEIVFSDSNFPAASHAPRLVRADGLGIPGLLEAILPLFPLDYTVDFSGVLMAKPTGEDPPVWDIYRQRLSAWPDGDKELLALPKPEFYERTRNAYCVVATGETQVFANLIIRKGVVK